MRIGRIGVRFAVAGLAAAGVLGGATARAQAPSAEEDRARAEQAFKEALADEQAGRYDKAAAELVDARNLAHKDTPQLLFHLGVCHAHLGKVVLARDELRVAADRAQAQGLETVASTARVQLSEIEGRIAGVKPAPPAHGSLTSLALDGVDVTAKVGTSIDVDPGTHVLQATFADHRSSTASVTVGAGERRDVPLPEPTGAAGAVSSPNVPGPNPADGPPPPSPPPALPEAPPAAGSSHGSSTLGWVVLGGGVALLGGGAAMWVLRGNAIGTLNGECGSSHQQCPQSASGTISNGKLYDDLGVAMFVAGGAAVLAGGGLLVFGGSSRAPASALLAPTLSAHGGGVGLTGVFR